MIKIRDQMFVKISGHKYANIEAIAMPKIHIVNELMKEAFLGAILFV